MSEGCVALREPNGEVYPIVWEAGTVMADAETVFWINQLPIPIGSEMTASTGQVVEAGVLPASVAGVSECASDASERVLVLDEGIIPHVSSQ